MCGITARIRIMSPSSCLHHRSSPAWVTAARVKCDVYLTNADLLTSSSFGVVLVKKRFGSSFGEGRETIVGRRSRGTREMGPIYDSYDVRERAQWPGAGGLGCLGTRPRPPRRRPMRAIGCGPSVLPLSLAREVETEHSLVLKPWQFISDEIEAIEQGATSVDLRSARACSVAGDWRG